MYHANAKGGQQRTVRLAVDAFLPKPATATYAGQAGGFAGNYRGLRVGSAQTKPVVMPLGASLLHGIYDTQNQKWVYGDDIKGEVEKKALQNALQKVRDREDPDQRNPQTVTYKYTEANVDAWGGIFIASMVTIIGLFFFDEVIPSTYVACMLAFLYALLSMLLSNGILLHPEFDDDGGGGAFKKRL